MVCYNSTFQLLNTCTCKLQYCSTSCMLNSVYHYTQANAMLCASAKSTEYLTSKIKREFWLIRQLPWVFITFKNGRVIQITKRILRTEHKMLVIIFIFCILQLLSCHFYCHMYCLVLIKNAVLFYLLSYILSCQMCCTDICTILSYLLSCHTCYICLVKVTVLSDLVSCEDYCLVLNLDI